MNASDIRPKEQTEGLGYAHPPPTRVAVVQLLIPDDAANRERFHQWRREQYDELLNDIDQRLDETKTPITDAENATWGRTRLRISGSRCQKLEWAEDARIPDPPSAPSV
jgi:hypothetical protein